MVFKELNPKLQLSFDEYVETWNTLVMEYYYRGLSDQITDKALHLSDQEMVRYSMDLAATVLIIAIRILKSKARISEGIRTRVSDDILHKFFHSLHKDASVEFNEECIKYFRIKYEIFNHICSNLEKEDAKKSHPELIGLARYLVAQVSSEPEHKNTKAIEKISLVLVELASVCLRLAGSSAAENQMLGKPKFIVQK